VAGLAATFGSGAMTNPSDDLLNASCIMAFGTNTTEAHPVIGMKVKQAAARGVKLLVVNPRRIDLVDQANLWLRPHPGTNVALLMGMARYILEQGWQDQAFIDARCESFEPFQASLAPFDLDTVADITGVPTVDIKRAAEMYATNKPASVIYAMGICEQSQGTDGVMALANLAMLTGNVGKPGTGINALRGQNNVQGACDMGALPDVFPGYQKVADQAALSKFEQAWGVTLNGASGLTLTDIMQACCEGRIKAMYLIGENPMVADPDTKHVAEALSRLEFLAVQDIFLTETASLAHVVLPGAAFAEKDGTFTNTERRVQRVRRAVFPPGDARPDWQIVCQVAKRIGAPGFDFTSSAEIMTEISQIAPIYAGISHTCLENGSRQWPCPAPGHPGTPRLHIEKFSRGRGRFIPLEFRPPQERPDAEYPLILTTGRSLYQYNSGTMTRKAGGLNACLNQEVVEVNPDDARQLNLGEGDMIKVTSHHGQVEVQAHLTDNIPPGLVYMNFHFAKVRTNSLFGQAADPQTKTPDYKVCAVRLEKLPEVSLAK
jgi:formate dehydrogenase (NADP+) alpha subunit